MNVPQGFIALAIRWEIDSNGNFNGFIEDTKVAEIDNPDGELQIRILAPRKFQIDSNHEAPKVQAQKWFNMFVGESLSHALFYCKYDGPE